MQHQQLLEQELTREELQALRNKRAGIFIFQISWIMAFVCMVIVNWQMRFSPNWKIETTQEASVFVGLLATVALVMSTVMIRRSQVALENDDQRGFLTQLQGTIALGGFFVLIMLFEWLTIETGTQYAQVFRLMTGFHMVHAVAIGVYLVVVYMNGRQGDYNALNTWAIEAGAKLWYFVLVAWLMFYIVIYWI